MVIKYMGQKELGHSTSEDDHVSDWNRYSVVGDRKGDYEVELYLTFFASGLVLLAISLRRRWPMMRPG